MAASGLAPDRQVGLFLLDILLFSSIICTCLNICDIYIYIYIYRALCPSTICLLQASTDEWNHLSELVMFALAMQETLREINRLSDKNFQLRVGRSLKHA